MYKIERKVKLAENIYLMDIYAPRVAKSAHPGQFIILRSTPEGERIPLTISDYDIERGTVQIVVQTLGVSTLKLAALEEGECVEDFAGPLGRPSDFVYENIDHLRGKKLLFVAGGVGTAPVYPQVKWLHEHGVEADVIIGAKTKDLLILTDEMRSVGNLYIATDDGSEGYHGMVTGLLKKLVEEDGKHYDTVITIGPMIMMKFVALTTKELGIPTIASLNSLMVDGTGMCGACRVSVGGQTKFTCVDGPEFDAHLVDFDEAMRRSGQYRDEEQRRLEKYKDHRCRIGLDK
ncbi:MAG: sulfide/dihydroorotate dehydrogenase-like FAD/NAD-binding protein [Tidjanibacter sp.]|jgi:ferredoxin--NADP+ reductase|nr:sulfide/dihydroorotate dehydrogenase-like FAD/NAD-binding protein [Tidjanibacter sp.]